MRKLTTFGIASVVMIACGVSISHAQLTDIDWNGATGSQTWQTAGNWVGGVVPNDTLAAANLSVPLNADLNVSLTGDITLARLAIGSSTSAVTTTISGSRLVFNNEDTNPIMMGNDADFNNNTVVNGRDFLIWQAGFGTTNLVDDINGQGDANDDHTVDSADLPIWEDQFGLGAGIFSTGSAGINTTGAAGVTNVIDSVIHIVDDPLGIGGSQDVTINGNVTYESNTDTGVTSGNTGIHTVSQGVRVNLEGNLTIANNDADEATDFYLNTLARSQGTLAINGVLGGEGDLLIGVPENSASLPLGTVELNSPNTFNGGLRVGRGNLVLGDDAALGTSSYRTQGPAHQYGWNLISTDDSRVIANDIELQAWQTIKGENSLTLGGEITQSNNRGWINLLPADKALTFTGRVNIFEVNSDTAEVERRFVLDGTGKTVISGEIRNDSMDATLVDPLLQVVKNGTGVLVIDVPADNNNHYGPDVVYMGNFHYASNDSLNVDVAGTIRAIGGAVGVDNHPAGQTLATNTAFLDMIEPTSTGGLMLAPSDAAVNLDFTSGSLANAGNMSVAAPETGLTYTGTITPADSTYKLGGGTGTLTLPDAQLTGANSLVVKNGGTVQLMGANTYTGSTTVITKYSSTDQDLAANDASNQGQGVFYDTLISPVLEVNHLADAGQASSVGSAAADAENIFLQGATLRYVGSGDSTDRLFTLGTGGGTLDSSGSGAVVFSNTGSVGMRDVQEHIGSITEAGAGNPNELYDLDDASDIIAGMTVMDPDPGGTIAFSCPNGNCIPAGTTITGVSNDGTTLGLSQNVGFVLKEDTRLVFGSVPRTLTLAGTNGDDNTIAGVIADSAAGSVVNVDKTGPGKWILSGANTYTGDTSVEEGVLSITNAFLDDDSTVDISGGVLDLDFSATDVIGSLVISGVEQADGLWGSLTNAGATFKTAFITGNGLLNVGGMPLGSLAAVPEPSALLLATLAWLGFCGGRAKRS